MFSRVMRLSVSNSAINLRVSQVKRLKGVTDMAIMA
jgi:hypothetical protein